MSESEELFITPCCYQKQLNNAIDIADEYGSYLWMHNGDVLAADILPILARRRLQCCMWLNIPLLEKLPKTLDNLMDETVFIPQAEGRKVHGEMPLINTLYIMQVGEIPTKEAAELVAKYKGRVEVIHKYINPEFIYLAHSPFEPKHLYLEGSFPYTQLGYTGNIMVSTINKHLEDMEKMLHTARKLHTILK